MSYAGDVAPEQAFAALKADPDAVLVDVRTRAEWTYVGLPDLAALGRRAVLVEWQRFPDGSVNDRFVAELREAGVAPGVPVYVLCRSGVRSAPRTTSPRASRGRWTSTAGGASPAGRSPDCRGGKDERAAP